MMLQGETASGRADFVSLGRGVVFPAAGLGCSGLSFLNRPPLRLLQPPGHMAVSGTMKPQPSSTFQLSTAFGGGAGLSQTVLLLPAHILQHFLG